MRYYITQVEEDGTLSNKEITSENIDSIFNEINRHLRGGIESNSDHLNISSNITKRNRINLLVIHKVANSLCTKYSYEEFKSTNKDLIENSIRDIILSNSKQIASLVGTSQQVYRDMLTRSNGWTMFELYDILYSYIISKGKDMRLRDTLIRDTSNIKSSTGYNNKYIVSYFLQLNNKLDNWN